MTLEIRWVEDLITLAEEKSFSKAAQKRHITQSAFTRRMQNLESTLGYALISRSGTELEFTETGIILLNTARQFKQQLYETLCLIHKTNNQQAMTLKFAIVHSLTYQFFSNFHMQINEVIQDYRIEIIATNVDDGLCLLKEGGCDFLISYANPEILAVEKENINALKIANTEIIPVSATDTTDNAIFDIKQKFPLLAYSQKAYLRKLMDEKISNQLAFDYLYETDNASNLKSFALQKLGIAWLPNLLIEDELKEGSLVRCDEDTHLFSIQQDIFIFKNYLIQDTRLDEIWCYITEKNAID